MTERETTERELHERYERVLADALRAEDPLAALRTELARSPAPLRNWLEAACSNEAGLRITALLCARLRFERLLHGHGQAAALFEQDPERFARTFRGYHRAVAPTAHGPRAEAALFTAWLTRQAPTTAAAG